MNKKLIISLAVIGVVAAIGIGATIAYFNDVETSSGNIFVAGTLDLKVDAGGAYYNGLECDGGNWQCEPWVDQVVDFDQGVRKNGTPVNIARSNPSAILGPAQTSGTPSDAGFTENDFTALGFYDLGFGGYVVLKFDNYALNGPGADIRVYEVTGGSYPDEQALVEVSQDGSNWYTLGTATRDEDFDLDTVGLPWVKYVRVTDDSNVALFESTADGFDVDAVLALHCGTNPDESALVNLPCDGSWNLTDLSDERFFNLLDIKPGDFGRNVISFHLYDNDGWVCLVPHDLADDENVVFDPETEAGDDALDGVPNGELSDEIMAIAWNDNDGDGYFEPNLGETLLYNGSFFNLFQTNLPIADSTTGNPLEASNTKWIGLAWCAGDISYDITWGLISCDGNGMGNIAQSDALTASLSAYSEQSRNNSDFECSNVVLP